MSIIKKPIAFITHGGGPWPIISLPGMSEIERQSMRTHFESFLSGTVWDVKGLIVVSGHWESDPISVNVSSEPTLLYDYSGFPPEAYQLKWVPRVDVRLAFEVESALKAAGLTIGRTVSRGFDHGVFVPLSLSSEARDRPIIQVSLHHSLDAERHLQLGQALQPLIDQGYGIVTTGNSYHNLRKIFHPDSVSIAASEQFDDWLVSTLQLPQPERWRALLEWESVPYARECHPRQEHFVPLLVAVGAAGDMPLVPIWQGRMNGMKISSFGSD